MSNPRGWIVLIGSLLALPGSTPQGLAQAARAELTGQVTAPDGAALPGATVTVRALSTNDVRAVITSDSGYYSLTALPPDRYTVTVALDGFKRFVQEHVPLVTGERVRLDVTLAIGALEESVIVSRDPSPLRADSGSLGQVVPNAFVVGLPLKGRSFVSLITLSPGVAAPPGSARVSDEARKAVHPWTDLSCQLHAVEADRRCLVSV